MAMDWDPGSGWRVSTRKRQLVFVGFTYRSAQSFQHVATTSLDRATDVSYQPQRCRRFNIAEELSVPTQFDARKA